MKQLAKYGTGLIALYLVVANGGKAARVFNSGANGGAKLIKTFQGR